MEPLRNAILCNRSQILGQTSLSGVLPWLYASSVKNKVSNRRIYPLINFQEIFHPTRCYLSTRMTSVRELSLVTSVHLQWSKMEHNILCPSALLNEITKKLDTFLEKYIVLTEEIAKLNVKFKSWTVSIYIQSKD